MKGSIDSHSKLDVYITEKIEKNEVDKGSIVKILSKADINISNIKTVVQTIKVLQQQNDFEISEVNIKNGLINVKRNTNLQGRWQVLQEKPLVICDTAHNAHGLKIVLKQIEKQ